MNKESIKAGLRQIYNHLDSIMVKGADAEAIVEAKQICGAIVREIDKPEEPQVKKKTAAKH